MLTLLARTLDRTIIVLDGPSMATLRARRQANVTGWCRGERAVHHIHSPKSTTLVRELSNTVGVLLHLESDEEALVLEHVNDNHYHCMVRAGAAEAAEARLPQFLRGALATTGSRCRPPAYTLTRTSTLTSTLSTPGDSMRVCTRARTTSIPAARQRLYIPKGRGCAHCRAVMALSLHFQHIRWRAADFHRF